MHIGKCCKLPISVAVLVLDYWMLDLQAVCQGYLVSSMVRGNIRYYGRGVMLAWQCLVVHRCTSWISKLLLCRIARSVPTWTADLLACLHARILEDICK